VASEVAICNRALQKLGAKRITSLDENSVNARACNACYEAVRDRLYAEHPWVFATDRAALAADAEAPEWGRSNSFTLPSDFIRMIDDYPEMSSNAKDWIVEGRKILTNDSAPLYVRYVKRETDPNKMDPLFRELVSCVMAEEMCEELTQSNTKKAALESDAEKTLKKAKKTNAIHKPPTESVEDSWITGRS
jgi:hypothetical protein